MSEFKDFLDQLKVRLTNPLIFSFLISWMVIHWQIILGAFYLTQDDLKALKYSNFLDFVAANIDWCNGFWKPLFWALVYTFLSPIVRLGIQYFNTWITKIGNARIRKVAQGGYIQYDLYDSLLEEVKGQRNRFEETVQQNNKLNEEANSLANQLFNLKKEKEKLFEEKYELSQKYNSVFDKSILNGKWKRTIYQNGVIHKTDEIKIYDGQIEIKQSDNTYYKSAYMNNFFIDSHNHINFVEVINGNIATQQESKYNFVSSLQDSGSNRFQGYSNGNEKIDFEKIPD